MLKFDCVRLLLCYYYFPALAIQISCWILSIFGGILTQFGLSLIPFYIDNYIHKFFFLINLPYFILIFLFNLTFFIFRYADLMNDELNLWGFSLCIFEVYVVVFGIVTNLINGAMIMYNIKYYQELSIKTKSKKYPMLKYEQIRNTKIILIIILIIWINILFLSISDIILINLKINDSYYNYKLSMEIENKNTEEQKNNMKKKKKIKKKKKKNPQEKKQNVNIKIFNDNNSNEKEKDKEKKKNDIIKSNENGTHESYITFLENDDIKVLEKEKDKNDDTGKNIGKNEDKYKNKNDIIKSNNNENINSQLPFFGDDGNLKKNLGINEEKKI